MPPTANTAQDKYCQHATQDKHCQHTTHGKHCQYSSNSANEHEPHHLRHRMTATQHKSTNTHRPTTGANTTQTNNATPTSMHVHTSRAQAYNEMGMQFGYHQSRGQLGKSAQLLTTAVGLDPGSGIFLANLAMAYHHLGLLRQAAAFSRQGVCVCVCVCVCVYVCVYACLRVACSHRCACLRVCVAGALPVRVLLQKRPISVKRDLLSVRCWCVSCSVCLLCMSVCMSCICISMYLCVFCVCACVCV